MALFTAYNHAFSATTNVAAGTSYATGAKCMIQLDVPASMRVRIVEYGLSFDGSVAATPATVELVQASAASTMSTAHTASTVVTVGEGAGTSRLNYGTTADTGYGNGAITTNTTEKTFDSQYISPTGQYVKQWPLGREPMSDADSFVQLRINTSATVNAIAYVTFEEISS